MLVNDRIRVVIRTPATRAASAYTAADSLTPTSAASMKRRGGSQKFGGNDIFAEMFPSFLPGGGLR